jgi:gas vesicle protein GvpL/GvpF
MTVAVESCYVFGIVAAGTGLPEVAQDGPARALRLVESGELAAVVGSLPDDRPLGRTADLLTHDRVVAALVDKGAAVLPARFGTVLEDEESVRVELLDARSAELRADLERLAGRLQYTVKIRFEEEVVLRELVATRPDIARLREATAPGTGTWDSKVRLGELVVRALEQLRRAEAEPLLAEVAALVAEHRVREPGAPEQVLDLAVLVDRNGVGEFERDVERLARRVHPRLRVRLAGPLPAYDFVGSA